MFMRCFTLLKTLKCCFSNILYQSFDDAALPLPVFDRQAMRIFLFFVYFCAVF